MSDVDIALAEEVSKYYDDPIGFINMAFEWGEGSLQGFDGLDDWQLDVLTDIAVAVKKNNFNGVEAVDPVQVAVSSGHGIGKSAFTAMIILWIMSTRPNCKGVVTANTGEQLKTKTMSELAKWHARCITGHWFEMNAMSIVHRAYPKTWRCDALTSREEASEGFAGLHAADSSPFYIFDEASAIPEKIWEVARGGLTDGEAFFLSGVRKSNEKQRFILRVFQEEQSPVDNQTD